MRFEVQRPRTVGRTFTDYSSGEDTLFVVRLDATGGEVWRRMLGTTHTPWSAAGERLCAVIELPDGGAAITAADSLDPFAQSRRVVTLGPDGAPVRDRLYPDGNLRAGGIARAADDQLVVIGPSVRSMSGLDFDAVRLDDLGGVRWSAGYPAPDSDDPRVIRRTLDGSFLVAGTTYSVPGSSSQGWILRLTDDGTFTCLF